MSTEDARTSIYEAIENIKFAMSNDSYVKNYVIAPLEIIASNESGYMTHDPSIDTLISMLEETDSADASC